MRIDKSIHKALGTMIENEQKVDETFKESLNTKQNDELGLNDEISENSAKISEPTVNNGDSTKEMNGSEKMDSETANSKEQESSKETTNEDSTQKIEKTENETEKEEENITEAIDKFVKEDDSKNSNSDKVEPMEETEPQVNKDEEKAEKSETSENVTTKTENKTETKKGAICLEPVGQTDSDSDDEIEDSKKEDSSHKMDDNDSKKDETVSKMEEKETKKDETEEAKQQSTSEVKPDSTTKSEEKEIDYKTALEELNKISSNSRSINEEDSQKKLANGLKRSSSTTEEPMEPIKKAKIEETLKTELDKDIKKTLQKLTREELEAMITNKIAESLSARSVIGDLRRKCDAYEEDVEKWKKKTQMLQKMCQDLNTVMKRYIIDVQNKNDNPTPIKITRSVGLQVVTDRARKAPGTPQSAVKPAVSPSTTIIRTTPTVNRASNAGQASPLTQTLTKVVSPVKATTFTPIAPKTVIAQPTTIIKTTSPARLQSLPSSVSVTSNQPQNSVASNQASNGSANAAKKVIDVVDIDSDDDEPKSKPLPSATNSALRVVPTSKLRGNTVQVNPGGALGSSITMTQVVKTVIKHPAPLPEPPKFQIQGSNMKAAPPKPTLKISRLTEGIILSWNMNLNLQIHAVISSYQIYAYQERSNTPVVSTLWKKVGDVKALDLPMACTLTQFSKGNKYHFAVRARDGHGRVGSFSDPLSISLT